MQEVLQWLSSSVAMVDFSGSVHVARNIERPRLLRRRPGDIDERFASLEAVLAFATRPALRLEGATIPISCTRHRAEGVNEAWN